MANPASKTSGPAAGRVPGHSRLSGEDRRAALVEAAATLLAAEGLDAVSMDKVAVRAGVSRPLMYKHFANRDELLGEVFRQKSIELDAVIVAAVEEANGFEDKLRVLVRSVLEAVSTQGPIFTPLLRADIRNAALRAEQRVRDRRTVRFFARLAMTEFGLAKAEATAATAVLLSGIESIRHQWRADPTPENRKFLEDLYVNLVIGGLNHLR